MALLWGRSLPGNSGHSPTISLIPENKDLGKDQLYSWYLSITIPKGFRETKALQVSLAERKVQPQSPGGEVQCSQPRVGKSERGGPQEKVGGRLFEASRISMCFGAKTKVAAWV